MIFWSTILIWNANLDLSLLLSLENIHSVIIHRRPLIINGPLTIRVRRSILYFLFSSRFLLNFCDLLLLLSVIRCYSFSNIGNARAPTTPAPSNSILLIEIIHSLPYLVLLRDVDLVWIFIIPLLLRLPTILNPTLFLLFPGRRLLNLPVLGVQGYLRQEARLPLSPISTDPRRLINSIKILPQLTACESLRNSLRFESHRAGLLGLRSLATILLRDFEFVLTLQIVSCGFPATIRFIALHFL